VFLGKPLLDATLSLYRKYVLKLQNVCRVWYSVLLLLLWRVTRPPFTPAPWQTFHAVGALVYSLSERERKIPRRVLITELSRFFGRCLTNEMKNSLCPILLQKFQQRNGPNISLFKLFAEPDIFRSNCANQKSSGNARVWELHMHFLLSLSNSSQLSLTPALFNSLSPSLLL